MKPHVTIYQTSTIDLEKYKEAKNWIKKSLPNYDNEDITLIKGPEKVEPFIYFHNKTELAVKPIGETFDNETHPVILVNHQYGVDKFMNLKFHKLKIGNMTTEEIDDAVKNSGAFHKTKLEWNHDTQEFEVVN